MITLDPTAVIAARLERQGLVRPLRKPDDYLTLFARLQPVSPPYFSYPGSPPQLTHRPGFDDKALTDELRSERIIIKGRFQGGTVSYVRAEDLELYAIACRKPLARLNARQQTVLQAIQNLGEATPRQIKEETGLRNKEIMPALHRLQEAFIVYEDQVDTEWERNWYEFFSEWPEVNLGAMSWDQAAAQVLCRFLKAHVFATVGQIKDWSRFAVRSLKNLLEEMVQNERIVACRVDGLGEGYILPEDISLQPASVPQGVFMLHKADLLVRSHASELKARFGDRETLQYLLIDGAFNGAVVGHWRIGPHDVEDVVVDLPAAQQKARRDEILAAVAFSYKPPFSTVLQYAGKAVK